MIRAALFVPMSNPRALVKARALAPDLVILDLEDSVAEGDKAEARDRLGAELAGAPYGSVAVRVNAMGTAHHAADMATLAGLDCDYLVLPKVEDAAIVERLAVTRPVLAMIETAAGVLSAPAIAEVAAGFIAGTNDLAASLALRDMRTRTGLNHALGSIVLAAATSPLGVDFILLDGVYNRLDDAVGFCTECEEGRTLGFRGKSLIHPSQIAPAAAIFGPSAEEIEDARALVDAARGGAERFRGRMVEDLHVRAAHAIMTEASGGKNGGGSL